MKQAKPSLPLKICAFAIMAFLISPSLVIIPMSFGDTGQMAFPPKNLSLNLYREYFSSPDWVSATILSFRIAISSTLLSLILGIPAAYALSRSSSTKSRLVMILLISPIMIPAIVIALGIYIYFSFLSFRNGELRLIVAVTVVTMPFIIITAMSGLGEIDRNLERVAVLMGAGPLTVLFRVVIPLLTGPIIAGAALGFLMAFDEVVISYFVSRPDSIPLPVRMFSSMRWEVSPVLAAISTILTVISAGLCISISIFQTREKPGE